MCQDGVEQWPWVAIDDTPAFYREDAPVVFTDSQTGFQLSDVPAFRGVVDGLLQSSTRTYLSEHPEEGVVIALVTNDVLEKRQYVTVLNGEADEEQIIKK